MGRSMLRRAALGLALGLLLGLLGGCGGSDDDTPPAERATTPDGPPIRIGTKNFTEQTILGELYRQALEAKGYEVVLKPDIGSSEIVHRALRRGALDMYPEYIGVLLSEVAQDTDRPPSDAAAYDAAQAFERRNGFTLLAQTPFADANALAVKPAFARRHRLSSIADLRTPQGHGEGRRAAGVRDPLRGDRGAARASTACASSRPSTPRAASATRCSTAARSMSRRCSRARASSPATTTVVLLDPRRRVRVRPRRARRQRQGARGARPGPADGDRRRHPRSSRRPPCAR